MFNSYRPQIESKLKYVILLKSANLHRPQFIGTEKKTFKKYKEISVQ